MSDADIVGDWKGRSVLDPGRGKECSHFAQQTHEWLRPSAQLLQPTKREEGKGGPSRAPLTAYCCASAGGPPGVPTTTAGSVGIRMRLRRRAMFFAAMLPLPTTPMIASRYPEDDRYRSSVASSLSAVDSTATRFASSCRAFAV